MDKDRFAVIATSGTRNTRKKNQQQLPAEASRLKGFSKESFFRLDKNYAPKDYDKSNKVLSPSHSDTTTSLNDNIRMRKL